MRKFLAVVKREYLKIVWKKAFIISTLLAPFIMSLFAIVPMIMFSIKGNAVRTIIADESGKISANLKKNLSGEKMAQRAQEALKDSFKDLDSSQEEKMKEGAKQFGVNFEFLDYDMSGKGSDQVKQELIQRVKEDKLDAYLIIPADIDAKESKFQLFSRNSSDFVAIETIRNALQESVRAERLARVNISGDKLDEINRKVTMTVEKVTEKGIEKDSGNGFLVGFILAFMLYLVLTLYGTLIMSAVVEEKETRISEILFSSARPFDLMMGKLVGVGLAGLTQVGIWLFALLIFATYGIAMAGAMMGSFELPAISFAYIFSFIVFFLLGFFTYGAIYALIGAIVSNAQEGGQFSFPPIMILMAGLYSVYPVVRDPNSAYAFWVSILPFISPMVMPARILIETPPLWQIALSIFINLITIAALTWLAARIYRVGMLMHGKRATIPEIWRWVWQS